MGHDGAENWIVVELKEAGGVRAITAWPSPEMGIAESEVSPGCLEKRDEGSRDGPGFSVLPTKKESENRSRSRQAGSGQ
jgi:hypothetical protein